MDGIAKLLKMLFKIKPYIACKWAGKNVGFAGRVFAKILPDDQPKVLVDLHLSLTLLVIYVSIGCEIRKADA